MNSDNTAGYQQSILYYCGSGSVVDIIAITFVDDVFYDADDRPSLDLANFEVSLC